MWWPFKKRTRPPAPPPEIGGIPTIPARHAAMREYGYEPVGHPEDDGPIQWRPNAARAQRIAEEEAEAEAKSNKAKDET